jgi:hypothetical protein
MSYRVFYAEKAPLKLTSPDGADILVAQRRDKGESGYVTHRKEKMLRC